MASHHTRLSSKVRESQSLMRRSPDVYLFITLTRCLCITTSCQERSLLPPQYGEPIGWSWNLSRMHKCFIRVIDGLVPFQHIGELIL